MVGLGGGMGTDGALCLGLYLYSTSHTHPRRWGTCTKRRGACTAHVLPSLSQPHPRGYTVELISVRQVPENRPRFPYLQQRLWRLSLLSRLWRLLLLSRQWAVFPIFQQLVYFLAAPRTRAFSGFGFTIEQILAFPPRVIVAKPPSMSHEHGFQRPGISI